MSFRQGPFNLGNILNVEWIGVNLISMYTQSLGRLVYDYSAQYILWHE